MNLHQDTRPSGSLSGFPSAPPSAPLRYLIRCRRSRFEQRGQSDAQVVEKLVKTLKLDADKVVHVATDKGPRRVHIVVDYDNPTHQRCPVRAFKGTSLKEIRLPDSAVDYLHGHVEIWNKITARSGGRFPIQQGDHVVLPPTPKKEGRNVEGDDELEGVLETLDRPGKMGGVINEDVENEEHDNA